MSSNKQFKFTRIQRKKNSRGSTKAVKRAKKSLSQLKQAHEETKMIVFCNDDDENSDSACLYCNDL